MQSISHESVHAQLHSYAKYNQYKNEIQKVKCSVLKAHHRLLAAVGCSTRRRHGKGQTYNAFEPQTSSYTSHTGLDSFDLSHAQQRYVHISWYNSREYNSISFTLTTHCLLKKKKLLYIPQQAHRTNIQLPQWVKSLIWVENHLHGFC